MTILRSRLADLHQRELAGEAVSMQLKNVERQIETLKASVSILIAQPLELQLEHSMRLG